MKNKYFLLASFALVILNLIVWGALVYVKLSHPLLVEVETIAPQFLKGVIIP
jgi:hypothetical protein